MKFVAAIFALFCIIASVQSATTTVNYQAFVGTDVCGTAILTITNSSVAGQCARLNGQLGTTVIAVGALASPPVSGTTSVTYYPNGCGNTANATVVPNIANNTCVNATTTSSAGVTIAASVRITWRTVNDTTTGTSSTTSTTGTTTNSATSVVVGSLFILAAILAF